MYSGYCDGMEPQGGRPAQPAQAIAYAHKLKGSAGTLGLRAIAEVAGRVEAALESGSDGVDLIRELRLTIEATRQDMLALGMARTLNS
jgi:HPt (histidine-containing phosphotransfer) domain-containing protein